jgi:hypothetical protein
VDHFPPAQPALALKTVLLELYASVWEDRWLKSPKKKIPKSTEPKTPINGGHTSIYRILRSAKQDAAKMFKAVASPSQRGRRRLREFFVARAKE